MAPFHLRINLIFHAHQIVLNKHCLSGMTVKIESNLSSYSHLKKLNKTKQILFSWQKLH